MKEALHEKMKWSISNELFAEQVKRLVDEAVTSGEGIGHIISSLDGVDPCSELRNEFLFPQLVNGHDCTYMLGNSLGLQPRELREMVNDEIDKWRDLGINGHFEGERPWLDLDVHGLPTLAAIVGAVDVSEVAMLNSVSINLHMLLTRFYKPNETRFKILVENKPFPSDWYAFESQIRSHGLKVEDCLVEMQMRPGEYILRTEDIVSKIHELGDTLAVLCFGGVQYYTGQLFDMKTLTEAAHDVGAFSIMDLAHAVGNVNLKLHEWNVDAACWCSYKYLNSGPGGIGGLFLHKNHHADTSQQLLGWWGHEQKTRFDMTNVWNPEIGAASMRVSHTPVLLVACHLASLKIFAKADWNLLRNKSLLMTTLLYKLLTTNQLVSKFLTIITPESPNMRGCQLSLLFKDDTPEGEVSKTKRLHSYLEDKNVITDYRHPNVIRVAPTPLYCRFHDVMQFVIILEEAVNAVFI